MLQESDARYFYSNDTGSILCATSSARECHFMCVCACVRVRVRMRVRVRVRVRVVCMCERVHEIAHLKTLPYVPWPRIPALCDACYCTNDISEREAHQLVCKKQANLQAKGPPHRHPEATA